MRRVLITGTSRGLGRSLADHYLANGCRVAGVARSEPAIEHEHYRHYQSSVTDEAGTSALLADLRQRWQGLDVLINSAGTAAMNAFPLTPPATMRRVMDVNFLGAAALSHGAIRLLRASPAARIVNLTTIAVPLRLEGEAVYAASKAALEMLTRIVAREVGRLGITCNAVGPSVMHTALTAGVPAEKLQRLIDQQAIPRPATPADVANVVDFFLRPESGLVTGQIVYLGGFG